MAAIQEVCHTITCTDGLELALWELPPNSPNGQHIFLTHGTFSNKKVCAGIASYLTEHGYHCWVLEWRNHGDSSPDKGFNFETIARYDIKSAFDYLLEQEKLKNFHCITHSGGGTCLVICLALYPKLQKVVESIVMFGCQTSGAAHTKSNYVKILLGKYLNQLFGYTPGPKASMGPQDEDYALMKQWYEWNLSGEFRGELGEDYMAMMQEVNLPILSICGRGDTFIAPPIGCQQLFDAFPHPQNQLLICGKKEGYSEDYNHSRILHSSSASQEIWPQVLNWIQTTKVSI
ncbi:MAG: alpha/beta fold hydrolase [Bacteroidota bacterium]